MKFRRNADGKKGQEQAAAAARTTSTVRSRLRAAGADAAEVSDSTTLKDILKRGAKVTDVELKKKS